MEVIVFLVTFCVAFGIFAIPAYFVLRMVAGELLLLLNGSWFLGKRRVLLITSLLLKIQRNLKRFK